MGCGSFGSGPFVSAPFTFGSGRVHMEWDCNNDDEFQDELTLELFNLAALPLSVSPLSANRHTIWLQGKQDCKCTPSSNSIGSSRCKVADPEQREADFIKEKPREADPEHSGGGSSSTALVVAGVK